MAAEEVRPEAHLQLGVSDPARTSEVGRVLGEKGGPLAAVGEPSVLSVCGRA